MSLPNSRSLAWPRSLTFSTLKFFTGRALLPIFTMRKPQSKHSLADEFQSALRRASQAHARGVRNDIVRLTTSEEEVIIVTVDGRSLDAIRGAEQMARSIRVKRILCFSYVEDQSITIGTAMPSGTKAAFCGTTMSACELPEYSSELLEALRRSCRRNRPKRNTERVSG